MTNLTDDLKLAEAMLCEARQALLDDLVAASSEQFDTGLSYLILARMGRDAGCALDDALELARMRALANET